MDDQEARARARRNFTNGVVIMGMWHYSTRLLAALRRKVPVDQSRLAEIRCRAITYAKNLDAEGLTIEDQGEVFRQAIQNLEQLIDSAVADSGKPEYL